MICFSLLDKAANSREMKHETLVYQIAAIDNWAQVDSGLELYLDGMIQIQEVKGRDKKLDLQDDLDPLNPAKAVSPLQIGPSQGSNGNQNKQSSRWYL